MPTTASTVKGGPRQPASRKGSVVVIFAVVAALCLGGVGRLVRQRRGAQPPRRDSDRHVHRQGHDGQRRGHRRLR
jgi:hypothetical protein